MKKLLLIILLMLFFTVDIAAQTTGDYRSNGNVTFIATTNWQVYNGSTWVAATSAPTAVAASNTITIQAAHTATNATTGTTIVASLIVNGELDVNSDFNTAAMTINGANGKTSLKDGIKLYVYGDVTVNSGGTFNSHYNPGTSTYFVVFGNYTNNGTSDFWKANVIIVGNLTSPSTSSLQNNGNVVVGGNLIGTFDFTGGDGSGQLYAIDPNATVSVTDSANGNPVIPPNTLSSESTALQNLVTSIFGTCIAAVATTWSGSAWSNGVPTLAKGVIIAGNYSGGSIAACNLTVNSGATLTINSGVSFDVNNGITNNGSIVIENGGSLVQINNPSPSFTGNPITYKRKTSALKQYDYTYWSSPVTSATLSQLITNWYFFSFSPSINNWVAQTDANTMTPGVGYIAMAPNYLTYSPTQIVETSFVGIPNNGNINVSIVKGAGTYSLIGNPYPSAIDIDLFLTDATNSTVVNGTIYLWTHNTAIASNVFTVNDYAKYNNTGGVKTATAAISGGVTPTNKIAAGQGFFIEANTAKANGTYTATFKNSMRIVGNNTQFYRTNNSLATQSLEKHRVWLSLSNDQGAYNEMLVGYVQGATNDFDSMYDGKTLPAGNAVSLYTMVGDYDLSIQGKSLPFADTDVIPIGYSTTIDGQLTINLENFDGLFESQAVYVLDKVTGIYHDIKAGSFTFTTASGTFESRFELHFTNTALNTVVPNFNAAVLVLSNQHQLSVLCDAAPITKVEVFDILGKQIFSQSGLNTNNFQTGNLSVAAQALLVKITLENDITVIKKTLMN